MKFIARCYSVFFTALCAGAFLTGIVSAGYAKTDPVITATGLNGRDLTDFEVQMASLRKYDREIYGKRDVSVEVAKHMTTEDLIKLTTRQGLWLLRGLYDNPNIGMYRASRCSNGLAELLRRQDFYSAFVEVFLSYNPNPKTHPHFEADGGLFATGWMISLLDYPPLSGQSVGHEKEILLALCRDYRKVQKVNASYPKGKSPYGDNWFPLGTAQRLAKRVFPQALINSANSPEQMEPAVKQLEALCAGSAA